MGIKANRRMKCQMALAAAASAVAGAAMWTPSARAASASWVAEPTDQNWTTSTNWSTNAVPGVVNPGSGGLSNDTVTFNQPIPISGIGSALQPVLIDNLRNVKFFVFDGSAGAYTFSTAGWDPLAPNAGNQLWLTTTGTGGPGAITMNAGVTNAQVFNVPINFRLASSTAGAFNLVNNAASSAATLTFNGTLNNSSANTRPLTLTLDGSNTGDNVIKAIADGGGANGAIVINKNGAGTWILAGANELPQKTSAGTVAAATVNAGTLVLQNAASLGSLTQGNIRVLGTGTMRFDGIALQNTGVTLDVTGRLLANGSSSVNAVAVPTTATDVTLATTNAADVFTVGVVSGATSTNSVVHVAGPGQVLLNTANTFGGTWSLDAGTTTLNNATALGPVASAGVAFGAGSTAKLQLNGNSITLAKLNTNASAGTPIIENGGGANSTLTLNTGVSNTYAGTLQDGTGGGTLALVKTGSGSLDLALTGANTYSGGTSINVGTIFANNTTGSATGSGPVTIANTATLGGGGTAGGAVTVNSGGTIAPGAAAGQIGTLHAGSLTLASGSKLDYDIASTSSLDQIIVDNADGLTINGGQVSINGGTAPFTVNGIYNLIGHTGAVGGTGISALTVNPNNQSLFTNSYTFGDSGGFVTLAVAGTGNEISYWNTDANGNWSTGPWTTATPNAAGSFAAFGGGGTPITAPRTVTVDGAFTVGTLAFNNPNFSYTLAGGPGATITLDNSAATSFVTNSAGTHEIQVPLAMTANGATFTALGAADTLTVSGPVSGTGSVLSKSGSGTLVLTGANSYSGGSVLNAGTVAINSDASLGDAAGGVAFNGGNLKLLADVTSARSYQVQDLANATINTNGQTLTHSGTISPLNGGTGGVVKNGAGTLVLQGTNSYVGATTVNAGTLSISSNASLGDPAAGAALNLGAGTTLTATASTALNNAGANARAVSVAAGGATVDLPTAVDLAISGPLTGGTVTKTGPGTLSVSNTANSTPFVVSAGTLNAAATTGGNGGLGTGAITLRGGGAITAATAANNTLQLGNALSVPTGETGTINAPNRMNWFGAVTGAGTLNVNVNTDALTLRTDFSNNWTGFTGNLNIAGTGTSRLLINGGGFGGGWTNAAVDLGGAVTLQATTNSTGNDINIAALSGSSTTATLSGGTAGPARYIIGSRGNSTSFAGVVAGNAAVIKVGAGTLTLDGANTHTAGTTVNAGTLTVTNTLSAATAPLTVNNTNTGAGPTVATLNLPAGTPTTTGSLSGSITTPGGAHTAVINNNGQTLTVNQTTAGTYAGSITGAGGFTLGSGSTAALTLSGANTYTGGTTVSANTLRVSRMHENNAVTVNAGGRLQVIDSSPTLPLHPSGNNAFVSRPSALAIANDGGALGVRQYTGTVDLGNNDLILDYTGDSPVAEITDMIRAGFNGGGWDGFGLISSTAVLDPNFALAIVDNAAALSPFGSAQGGSLFSGVDVDATSVLVKFTHRVDLDLDGLVTSNDAAVFNGFYNEGQPATWSTGDLDYDGLYTSNDAAIFNGFYNESVLSVPEPATAGVLALAMAGLLGRRGRRAGRSA